MIDIGTLSGKIALDGVDRASKDLESIGKNTDSLDSKFNSIIGTAKKVVAGLAIGATIKAGWDAATKLVNDFADAGDRIDKSSQKMSMSAESFQRWESIAGHNGSSVESYATIMKKLADTTDSNAEAFTNLGIVVTNNDGSLRTQEEIFYSTVEALAGMEDGTERNRLAQDLLGKGYTELLPLINGGTEALKEQWDASSEAVTMTDEQVKSAAAYKDAQQAMEEQITKVKMALVEGLVPVLKNIMDWTTQNVPKIKEVCQPVFDFIGEVINTTVEIINWLIETLVEFWNSNEEVQEGVFTVWESIKEVFSLAFETIRSGVDAFVKIFRYIWETYGEEITTYATMLWNNVKILFQTTFDAIRSILNIFKALFTGDWDTLWQEVRNLVETVWNGMKEWISNTLDGIVDIIDGIGPKLYDTGVAIFEWLWDGLKSMWTNISSWLSDVVAEVWDALTFWDNSQDKMSGSHRTGLSTVPYDGYSAMLHKGEMVLTQAEADRYRKQEQQTQQINNVFDTSSLENKIDKLIKATSNIPKQMQINANMA